jgi:hypothetical protein
MCGIRISAAIASLILVCAWACARMRGLVCVCVRVCVCVCVRVQFTYKSLTQENRLSQPMKSLVNSIISQRLHGSAQLENSD